MTKDLKYYLYVSKIKVDMLWEQISITDRDSILTDLKVNLGIISVGLKELQKNENIYDQLKVVIEYLSKNDQIGTMKNQKTFFKGSIDMSWEIIKFEQGGKMLFFSGIDNESGKTIILVGSVAHVIGMNNIEPAYIYYNRPSFWMKILEELDPPSEQKIMDNLLFVEHHIDYKIAKKKGVVPKQKLEFIAKTYISNEDLIIGSPIYVAESN